MLYSPSWFGELEFCEFLGLRRRNACDLLRRIDLDLIVGLLNTSSLSGGRSVKEESTSVGVFGGLTRVCFLSLAEVKRVGVFGGLWGVQLTRVYFIFQGR